MNAGIAVLGCGTIGPAGDDLAALARTLADPATCRPVAVGAMYPDALPAPTAYALPDFAVRAELGRRGTSSFDRRTSLTVIACGRALRDSVVEIDDTNRDRIGIVVGTTAGSVRSSVDYAVETFVEDPPHMVNPALFPNTVMNCAAGQAAIWYRLHGANATLAGGPLALLSVLRYTANLFRAGKADAVVAAVTEEFTPHTAWLTYLTGPARAIPGEGGAAFVLSAGDDRPDAEILAVRLGFCPTGSNRRAALAGLVWRTVRAARVDPATVDLVATGAAGTPDRRASTWDAVLAGLDRSAYDAPEHVRVDDVLGDCQAATAGFELAAILGRHRSEPERDGRSALLVAQTPEGGIGTAVVRGWSRPC